MSDFIFLYFDLSFHEITYSIVAPKFTLPRIGALIEQTD